VGHTHTVLGTSTGETYKVLGADVGGKDSHTDYIPWLTLTEKVSRRVFALLGFLVFPDGIPDSSHHSTKADGENYPIEPDEFM